MASRKRAFLWIVPAVVVGLGLIGLLAGLIYFDAKRTDGFFDKLREIAIDRAYDIAGWFKEAPPGAEGLRLDGPRSADYSSALLDLALNTYVLVDVPRCQFTQVGAIARLGDDLVFGSCAGRFYRLKLGTQPTIDELPFSLKLGADAIGEFVGDRAELDATTVTVHDLLALDDGRHAVSYTQWDPDRQCVAFRVATVNFEAGESSLRNHFEAKPCIELSLDGGRAIGGHQAGGRMVQTGPETILVSIGDFEFDGVTRTPQLVQTDDTSLGKTIEINLVTDANRVVSTGHRNPQGLVRLENGEILSTEHGPQGGDELNVIEEGQNYGWPYETLGTQYGGEDWPLAEHRGRHDTYREPLFAWVPSIGISQLIEVRDFDPVWDGDLLVESMATHTLFRLRPATDRILYSEPMVMKDRLRDITQDALGRIVMLTDTYKVITIEPASASAFQMILSEAPAETRRIMMQCLQCHTLSPDSGASGRIPLAGLIGRRVASSPDVEYSAELLSQTGVWDRDRLDRFLSDPSVMTPDSAMAGMAVEDAELRSSLIDLLDRLSAP